FFFSSRRRHTRSKRDWSSDVCSSDLTFLLYWKLVEAFQIISEKETFAVPKKMLRFGYSLYLVIIVSEFYPLVMIIGIILATVVITLHMTYRSQITAMSNDQN